MNQNNPEGVRKPVLYAVVLLAVVAVGAVVLKKVNKAAASTGEAPAITETAEKPNYVPPKPLHAVGGGAPAESEPAPAAANPVTPKPVQTAAGTPPPVALPRPEPTPETRGLVSALANLDLKTAPLTAEAAEAWKQNLARLVQHGAASVPAIQEFLDLKRDTDFNAAPGAAGLLGSSSLRLSLLDALGNIPGPEALALSAQTLQSTTDPREIALLAQNLERQAPEQYREAAVAAARAAMAEASAGRLQNKDVGPLFDILRNFGGANAVQDFQQAASGPWKYYATIALAELPDGAGIPTLIQMASDPKNSASGRVPALQALAQWVPENADARNLMLEQARQGSIPPATWINIAGSLAGDRFQIGTATGDNNPNLRTWRLSYGNQSYFASPGPLTAEQVQQRLGLVNEFIGLNNNNPLALRALEDARNKLMARQGAPIQ